MISGSQTGSEVLNQGSAKPKEQPIQNIEKEPNSLIYEQPKSMSNIPAIPLKANNPDVSLRIIHNILINVD